MRKLLIAAMCFCAGTQGALAAPAPSTTQAQPAPSSGPMMHHGPMQHRHHYMESMRPMHQSMMRTHDADADRTFAFMMIEHHRAADAMIDTLMQRGDDAELKRMAEGMRAAQRDEIARLEAWLDRHGGRTPKP